MVDHLALTVTNYTTAFQFLTKVLPALKIECVVQLPNQAGFGRGGVPTFWLRAGQAPNQARPLQFRADSPQQLEALCLAALAHGGRAEKPAPIKEQAHAFGTRVHSPCGVTLVAVYHP